MMIKQLSLVAALLAGLLSLFASCGREVPKNEESPPPMNTVSLRATYTFQSLLKGTLRSGETVLLSDIDSLHTDVEGITLYLANFRNNGFLLFREDEYSRMEILGFSDESSMHYADTLQNEALAEYVIKPALRAGKSHEASHIEPDDGGVPDYNPNDPESYPRYTTVFSMLSTKRYCEPSVYPLFRQGAPFNALISKRRPVGCGPIAIAEILSHYETQVGGAYVDWKELKTNYCSISKLADIGNGNPSLLKEIQSMMRDIWTYCRFSSGKNYTMSTKWNILGYLRRNGYQAECYSFRNYDLASHFRNGAQTPLIIRGWDTPTTAHYWVIDAALLGEYKLITVKYIPRTRERTIVCSSVHKSLYYHCVWGWGGKHNGWYKASYFYAGKSDLPDNNREGIVLRLASPNEEDHYLPTKVFKAWR